MADFVIIGAGIVGLAITRKRRRREQKARIVVLEKEDRPDALVTDFLVESGPTSTHVLNAISSAFTSAFPLARYICDNNILK